MKIKCISDLHLEFYEDPTRAFCNIIDSLGEDFDVLILAGDIGYPFNDTFSKCIEYVGKKFKTILVPGNHEYYCLYKNMEKVDVKLAEICDEYGVVLLNQKTVEIDGIKFIGCTGWTNPIPSTYRNMNDSRRVFKNIEELRKIHSEHLDFLKREITPESIVITHHLPTFKLVHPVFKDCGMNDGFAFEYNSILPKFWFCGHSHEYNILQKENTIFYCNPVGYPGETRVTRTETDRFFEI